MYKRKYPNLQETIYVILVQTVQQNAEQYVLDRTDQRLVKSWSVRATSHDFIHKLKNVHVCVCVTSFGPMVMGLNTTNLVQTRVCECIRCRVWVSNSEVVNQQRSRYEFKRACLCMSVCDTLDHWDFEGNCNEWTGTGTCISDTEQDVVCVRAFVRLCNTR